MTNPPPTHRKKAQLFSTDLIISVVLFIAILLSVIWIGEFINTKVRSMESNRVMGIMAEYAISSLVETEGQPADWHLIAEEAFNESNVASLGLVEDSLAPRVLDLTKLDRLSELNATKYSTIQRLLGLRGADYDFYISVQQQDRPQGIEIGISPPENSQNIIIRTRHALINNTYANISLVLWERCKVMCE